jgi:hypothetical protein
VPVSTLLALLLGQAAPAVPAADLARIRKALDEPAPIAQALDHKGDRPVFRITIRGPKPPPPLWETDSMVPGWVRPGMPGTHFDYLSMTTPEAFRASTLYPGFSVGGLLKLLGYKELSKKETRRRKEAKARQEVVRELEAFLRAQTIK